MIKNKLAKLMRNIKKGLIQDVPNELAACEDCRKTECCNALWEGCENRIRVMNKLNENQNGSE